MVDVGGENICSLLLVLCSNYADLCDISGHILLKKNLR